MRKDRAVARRISAYREGLPTRYGNRMDSAELMTPKESCEI